MFPFLILTLLFVLLPEPVYAWGAGVHLGTCLRVLAAPTVLPQALQALLAAYPLDYLYGCIAADITLGKKHTHHLEHCHNWRIGRKILERGKKAGPEAEACAYGYLSHLAADTVAHNYFVPYKLAMTFNTTFHNHAYWEIRADIGVKKETWQIAQQLAKRNNRQLDKVLSGSISDTIFSFGTNKQIFNSMMLISRLNRWQKMVKTIATHSRWPFDRAEHDEYMALGLEAVFSILSDEQSPYWNADPTGDRALTASNLIRKNMKLLWLDGKLEQEDADLILQELRKRFRLGITNPDEILPLFTVV
ncbi:zinc dependent phospholipase C family protein [Pelovirga terrestris]|uniref:Zinc dependent phospholipase C family protein n=1 Tax=Pelovirga terrestris TaxID=2771352 RepID=A0A8J6UG69_9BACT|nr:zinc dependent phospholipase C family protein [Pelovirga terrestris]MBD1399208.1 zinc dependent phospholipase C family protein [Pelovirga terrestris]